MLSVAKKQECLVPNRVEELKRGAPPKTKRKKLAKYDKRIGSAIRQYKRGTFTRNEHLMKIFNLKSDFGIDNYN